MMTARLTATLARRYGFFLFLILPYAIALASPLHDAARSGKLSDVQKSIDQGADVNGVTLYGFTPLLLAKLNDHKQTAALLQKKGARTRLDALVKRLQFYLTTLGYDTGGVDGLLGPGTRSAIRKFQAAEQFEVTGRVYEAWVIRLHRNVWRQLQQALRQQGIDPGPADGLMGPSLRKAIRAYQEQSGLPVTGQVSEAWVSRILAPAATDAVAAKPQSATVAQESAARAADKTPPGGVRTLREIQARLQELGYYGGPLDGELGASTVDAIRAFQAQTGLAVTGRVEPGWIDQLDNAVWRSLRSRLEVMGYDDKVYLDFKRAAADSSLPAVPALPFTESEQAPADIDSEDETAAAQPVDPPAAGIDAAPPTPPDPDPDRVLLASIQSRLRALGFDLDTVDGSMSADTRTAVASFQRQTGQAATGQPSTALLQRLDEEVLRAIQTRLKTLGYYLGVVDGVMGSQSAAAIRAFQQQAGLPVTGEPDVDLLARLTQAVAAFEAGKAQQEAQVQALKSVQEKLQVLGFDTGGADGQMGTKTEQAIKAFQQQFNLPRISGEHGLRVLNEKLDIELVRLVQNYLQILGFQPGSIDGQKGERTEAAIRSFQTRYKYAVDGKVSVALALALKEHIAEREARERAEREAQLAKQVQTELLALGYKIGAVDGEIGPSSRKAIRAFQRKRGVAVTGKISEALLTSLQDASKPPPAAPVSESRVVIEAEQSKPKPQISGTLPDIVVRERPGNEGKPGADTVAKIQARLNDLGYKAGPADGVPGPATKTAIEAFERTMGVPVTGNASPDLLKKLQSKSAKRAPKQLISGRRTKRGNTEVRGELRFRRTSNGTLIGCSIKGVQLDRVWCSPFTARRNTNDCKAIIRPNSTVLLVKCS